MADKEITPKNSTEHKYITEHPKEIIAKGPAYVLDLLHDKNATEIPNAHTWILIAELVNDAVWKPARPINQEVADIRPKTQGTFHPDWFDAAFAMNSFFAAKSITPYNKNRHDHRNMRIIILALNYGKLDATETQNLVRRAEKLLFETLLWPPEAYETIHWFPSQKNITVIGHLRGVKNILQPLTYLKNKSVFSGVIDVDHWLGIRKRLF